jgi:hypothetical protein
MYRPDLDSLATGETLRAVSLPVFAGLLVRALPVLIGGFPLNDGGLFYAMTRDLQNANFLLPVISSYNGLDIPFAYPPLGFYLAGLLSTGLGIDLIDLFRFLPMVLATAMIPVVYLLGREILGSRFQALVATWAFALLPRSFDWLIAGGGLTRSLGLLFALVAILEGIRFYRSGRRTHGGLLAVFAALTALSHPQAALFVGISMVLMFLAYGRSGRALRDSVALAALAALLAAPWWLTVISIHGIDPFISGSQTGTDLQATFQHLVTFTITDEPYTAFLAVLAVIGLVAQVATRRYLLAAWIVAVFLVDPRGGATELMAPVALLIGVAVDEVILRRPSGSMAGDEDTLSPRSFLLRDRVGGLLLVVGLLLGVIGAVKAPTIIGSPLHALPASSRSAMAWIAENAPPSAEFAVVTGNFWFVDSASEWFPVLAGHRSLATLQGYEWLGRTRWFDQARRFYDLQTCAYEGAQCLDKWVKENRAEGAWIFAPASTADTLSPTSDCCKGFREAMEASPDYERVFSGPGGDIFRPRSAGSS